MTYETALAVYRHHHPAGPEPYGPTSESRQVNGHGINWHLRTASGEYLATVKNGRSRHGAIGYAGPRGRSDKRETSAIPVADRVGS